MKRKAVLVTGGARRIGAAISCAFGAAGWHVVIHCRNSVDEARELSGRLPSAEIVRCDLADGAAAQAMARDLAGRLQDWRCLVNNAAIFPHDDGRELDRQSATCSMQVNALTPALLSQTFLSLAKAAKERRIIQLTDQKLENPNPDFFSYTMSKHAVAATVPMLAKAFPDDRIYALAPGAILPSHDQSIDEAERSHRLNLLGRRTRAREIAQAALFMAEGTLASGQTVFVDSGQHLLDQERDVIFLSRNRQTA